MPRVSTDFQGIVFFRRRFNLNFVFRESRLQAARKWRISSENRAIRFKDSTRLQTSSITSRKSRRFLSVINLLISRGNVTGSMEESSQETEETTRVQQTAREIVDRTEMAKQLAKR